MCVCVCENECILSVLLHVFYVYCLPKAYFRHGKALASEHLPTEACGEFCRGLFCEKSTTSDRADFLVEIVSLVPEEPGL